MRGVVPGGKRAAGFSFVAPSSRSSVTVLAYSGVLLTAIAGLVLYNTAGTRGTSRSARASA